MAVVIDGGGGDRKKPLHAELNLVPYIDLLTAWCGSPVTAVWTQLPGLTCIVKEEQADPPQDGRSGEDDGRRDERGPPRRLPRSTPPPDRLGGDECSTDDGGRACSGACWRWRLSRRARRRPRRAPPISRSPKRPSSVRRSSTHLATALSDRGDQVRGHRTSPIPRGVQPATPATSRSRRRTT